MQRRHLKANDANSTSPLLVPLCRAIRCRFLSLRCIILVGDLLPGICRPSLKINPLELFGFHRRIHKNNPILCDINLLHFVSEKETKYM